MRTFPAHYIFERVEREESYDSGRQTIWTISACHEEAERGVGRGEPQPLLRATRRRPPQPSHGKDFLSGRLTHADEQEPRTVEPGKNTLNTDPLPAWLSTAMEPR